MGKRLKMQQVKKKRYFYYLIIFTALLFSGCGTEDNKQDEIKEVVSIEQNHSIDIPPVVEKEDIFLRGKVIDGEISKATVFLDLNRNDELDNNEPKTITTSDGSFQLTISPDHQEHNNYKNQTAPLVAFGGEDIRTNQVFDDYLMSMREDKNFINITPFSTLIAQTLLSETDEIETKKVNKTSTEEMIAVKRKIAKIKKELAQLFDIKESILDKNPIDLAKAGDNALLSKSLQLHKSARSMRRAMKRQVRGLKKSILKSYRALSRKLRKLKRKAMRKDDNVLLIALDSVMEEDEIFDKNLIKK